MFLLVWWWFATSCLIFTSACVFECVDVCFNSFYILSFLLDEASHEAIPDSRDGVIGTTSVVRGIAKSHDKEQVGVKKQATTDNSCSSVNLPSSVSLCALTFTVISSSLPLPPEHSLVSGIFIVFNPILYPRLPGNSQDFWVSDSIISCFLVLVWMYSLQNIYFLTF